MSLEDINPQIATAPTSSAEMSSSEAAPASNGTTMKDTIVNNTASAVNAVQNHPITQNIANGPVATSVKNQAGVTGDEFSGLANSRQTPSHTAANDTTLTHYHSFFYTLLSWEHPRATGLTFVASVLFIFACRYLPVVNYLLKVSWMSLGVVTLTEIASKFVAGTSVAGSLRPRKYYKIPKESLEASLDDLEQFINFFVIEVQRIVFAESIPVTAAAFAAALLSFLLIKILPMWGMALFSTSVVFLAPLIYVQNKEFIDGHIEHAGNIIGQQATQVKDLTAQHTSKGFETVKAYTGDYAAKASNMVGQSRQKIPMPATGTTGVKENDFPSAPQTDLSGTPSFAETSKPVVHAPTEGEPIAASSI